MAICTRIPNLRERVLNAAIAGAEISETFEDYLAIFDAFYAEDIEVSSETAKEPIRGKDRVRALLANFLVPLHVMAEIACSHLSGRPRSPEISLRRPILPGRLN